MRKFILCVLLSITAWCHADIVTNDIRFNTVRPEQDLAKLLRNKFAQHNIDIASAGVNRGTGRVFYVDSNAGGSATSTGTTPASAWPTLDDAFDTGHVVANRGDVVYVMQGHTESVASAGAISLDVDGVTVIGLGNGNDRPTFTIGTAATASISIEGASVTISNLLFESGLATLAHMVAIQADDCVIDYCEFRDSTSGLGAISIGFGQSDGDGDRFVIQNCKFYQPGTTNDHSIEILFDMVGGKIFNNIIFGDYDEGAIAIPAAGNACLDLDIIGNVITNQQTGIGCIIINGTATTGNVAYNTIFTDTFAGSIDPGSLKAFENYTVVAGDVSGTLSLPAEDSATNLLGVDDSSNLGVTTNVTADADGSVLERIELVQSQTGGADIATNFIGVDDAANLGLTTAIVADHDGSMLERLEAISQAAVPTFNTNNYFTVVADMTSATWNTVAAHEIATITGAVRIQVLIETTATVVTVGTNGTLALGYAGNTAAIFSATALDAAVTNDVWTAVYGSAATTVVGGADAKSALTSAIFDVVVVGGVDMGYTIATNAGTTGDLTFHIWWTPLDATGAVVAGAGGVL